MATSGSSSCILGACLLVGLFAVADGSAFRTPRPILDQVKASDLRAAMLDELMSALGGGSRVTEERLASLEEAMRPTFLSLPKNTDGNLDHAAVRYILHRIFVSRHGMFIKGLHPGEEANTSATMVLEDRVPSYVQALFEDRLQGRGMGLHEVAMLAATLEHLIHDENSNRLKLAYEAYEISLDEKVPESRAGDLVEMYMVFFLKGREPSTTTRAWSRSLRARELASVQRMFPIWPASRKFAAEVLKEVVAKSGGDPSQLPFSVVASAVEEIGERFGKWQNHECQDMKSTLLSIEQAGTGRVLLKDFYAKSAAFSESKSYLDNLGSLDVSDPNRPSVIVPNYINAHANCLASSGMFSVCCLNECEDLFGHLEREVAEPDATPERILEVVANLPSATVQAPRVLSETLRSRLQEVANHHGEGRVPLHGRLFTQWMHHAYPRECPYPHLSGTVSTELLLDAGRATQEEKMFYMDALGTSSADAPAVGDAEISMWSTDEELVTIKAAPRSSIRDTLRAIAFLVAVGSACVTLRGMALSAFGNSGQKLVLPFANKDHYC